MNLAGTWQFRPEKHASCHALLEGGGGLVCTPVAGTSVATTIRVPGGGWYKQGFTTVTQAMYSRQITVPDIGAPQVTKLFFGAVNNEATVRIDGKEVGTQITAFTPSVFDISRFVTPGKTHSLTVDVKGRYALLDSKGYNTVPQAADWQAAVAQGIFRSAGLQVFPAVYVSDVAIRTSVKTRTLAYDVWITNAGDKQRSIRLDGDLGSWNRIPSRYPALPSKTVDVPAGQTRKVTVGPTPWLLGTQSYWWPNIPYRPGYRARLHLLRLRLDGSPAASYRFGFREMTQVDDQTGHYRGHYELNGVHINLRGDSLTGADYDGIDYDGGYGDAYGTYPGFLPPTAGLLPLPPVASGVDADVAGNRGWPKAVDNYQRLNVNFVRIHEEPATPYMLDVADEMGLMVQDEPALRGNHESWRTGRTNYLKHEQDLVRRDRNHAAVVRWSLGNELFTEYDITNNAYVQLYNAITHLDGSRPISHDGQGGSNGFPKAPSLPYANFALFCHYAGTASFPSGYTDAVCPSKTKPYGQGEFLWPADATRQGFEWFATSTEKMREKNASDIRPFTLGETWASHIPGVKTADMPVEASYLATSTGAVPPAAGVHPVYGEDNLPDPWINQQIQRVQRGFAPVLVADRDYWEAQKQSDAAGRWPAQQVNLPPSTAVTRTLDVFNDTLAGTHVDVRWELHRQAATGPLLNRGAFGLEVALGSHRAQTITFTTPAASAPGGSAPADMLYLTLSASKPGACASGGGQLFQESQEVFNGLDAQSDGAEPAIAIGCTATSGMSRPTARPRSAVSARDTLPATGAAPAMAVLTSLLMLLSLAIRRTAIR